MSFSKKQCQRNHTVVGRTGAFWPYYLDIYNQIIIWTQSRDISIGLVHARPSPKESPQPIGCLTHKKPGRILRFDLPFACLRNVESLCQI